MNTLEHPEIEQTYRHHHTNICPETIPIVYVRDIEIRQGPNLTYHRENHNYHKCLFILLHIMLISSRPSHRLT